MRRLALPWSTAHASLSSPHPTLVRGSTELDIQQGSIECLLCSVRSTASIEGLGAAGQRAGGSHLADVLNSHSSISVLQQLPNPHTISFIEVSPVQQHVRELLAAAAAAKGFNATWPARCAVGVLFQRR